MKTHKPTAALTIADRELVVRALRALVSEEQKQCVRYAHDKYWVDDDEGGSKNFDGNWNDLVHVSRNCVDFVQRPIRATEALAVDVDELIGRIQP